MTKKSHRSMACYWHIRRAILVSPLDDQRRWTGWSSSSLVGWLSSARSGGVIPSFHMLNICYMMVYVWYIHFKHQLNTIHKHTLSEMGCIKYTPQKKLGISIISRQKIVRFHQWSNGVPNFHTQQIPPGEGFRKSLRLTKPSGND